ncbi:MAG: hypothetical protein KDB36_18750 [Acidimicrobiales bacterium]|nr:hypothetical protein [Acidimicrobiales bacterium]
MDVDELPHEPADLEDLHIPWSVLEDLVLRRAYLDGHSSTIELAETLCVSPMVMEQAIEELRHNQLIDVRGRERRNYFVAVTDLGHEQVNERLALSRYAGAVPVSLDDYTAMVRAQDHPALASHETVRRAFADLVIGDKLLNSIGPALRANGAIFLYGPPGTGKSAIAERLNRIHTDAVLVPRTVLVDGQIVVVYDPVVHEPIDPQPERLDRRWVLCRRPSVIVGGELTAGQLNLTYEPHAGIYLAPIQMQANNGILVIDDFGRQALTPEQLLNRWIVPLDRSIDYLTLDYGVKFEIPLTTKIVFSTNLEPSHLADEAFFRRIRSKVLVPAIEDAAFDEILTRVAAATGVEVTADAPAHLRRMSREQGDGDLRPYLPGAVCELVRSITAYDDEPAVLDVAMVDRIVELYFTQDPGVHAARVAHLAAQGITASPEVVPAAPAGSPPEVGAAATPGCVVALRDAVAEATHRLLWCAGAPDVRAVVVGLAAALADGVGPAAGADDEVVAVEAPGGVVLRATVARSHDVPARRALERFVEDAGHLLALLEVPEDTALVAELADAEVERHLLEADVDALQRVLARLSSTDAVVALRFAGDGADPAATPAALAACARSEVRGHDRAGPYGRDHVVVVVTSDSGDPAGDAAALVARLAERWRADHPAAPAMVAGVALASVDPSAALVAAVGASDRAAVDATPLVLADAAEYR